MDFLHEFTASAHPTDRVPSDIPVPVEKPKSDKPKSDKPATPVLGSVETYPIAPGIYFGTSTVAQVILSFVLWLSVSMHQRDGLIWHWELYTMLSVLSFCATLLGTLIPAAGWVGYATEDHRLMMLAHTFSSSLAGIMLIVLVAAPFAPHIDQEHVVEARAHRDLIKWHELWTRDQRLGDLTPDEQFKLQFEERTRAREKCCGIGDLDTMKKLFPPGDFLPASCCRCSLPDSEVPCPIDSAGRPVCFADDAYTTSCVTRTTETYRFERTLIQVLTGAFMLPSTLWYILLLRALMHRFEYQEAERTFHLRERYDGGRRTRRVSFNFESDKAMGVKMPGGGRLSAKSPEGIARRKVSTTKAVDRMRPGSVREKTAGRQRGGKSSLGVVSLMPRR